MALIGDLLLFLDQDGRRVSAYHVEDERLVRAMLWEEILAFCPKDARARVTGAILVEMCSFPPVTGYVSRIWGEGFEHIRDALE